MPGTTAHSTSFTSVLSADETKCETRESDTKPRPPFFKQPPSPCFILGDALLPLHFVPVCAFWWWWWGRGGGACRAAGCVCRGVRQQTRWVARTAEITSGHGPGSPSSKSVTWALKSSHRSCVVALLSSEKHVNLVCFDHLRFYFLVMYSCIHLFILHFFRHPPLSNRRRRCRGFGSHHPSRIWPLWVSTPRAESSSHPPRQKSPT